MAQDDPIFNLPPERTSPTIGIITALPTELAAVKTMLDRVRAYEIPGARDGAGRRYDLGHIPAANDGTHAITVALLSDMGNNMASVRATRLLEHFPYVQFIIMVGIACGVPHPTQPDHHVRLGDIVVSGHQGIVQYDFIKQTATERIHRHRPRPPSADLLEAVQLLQADTLLGHHPWHPLIDQVGVQIPAMARPPQTTDTLYSSTPPHVPMSHPVDAQRLTAIPRVFVGPIGAANRLLKDALERDQLRDQFGVKAIEMEGSGISDATWSHEVGYLVVRGICDYGDSYKTDTWQPYAALVAAAYTRVLLERIEDRSLTHRQLQRQPIPHGRNRRPATQYRYQLATHVGDTQLQEALNRWTCISTVDDAAPRVQDGCIRFGSPEATTFYQAPVTPIAHCRVGWQVRIIDDGGDPDNWIGFRVRGFDLDIRLGYLVYLRRSGRVELHRGHEVIAGTDEYVVTDTKQQWTDIRMDIYKDTIWIVVNQVLHRVIRDQKFCDAGLIYIHTFRTHSEFRDFYVQELKRAPRDLPR